MAFFDLFRNDELAVDFLVTSLLGWRGVYNLVGAGLIDDLFFNRVFCLDLFDLREELLILQECVCDRATADNASVDAK